MNFFFCLLLQCLILLPVTTLAAETVAPLLTAKDQKTESATAQRDRLLKSYGRFPMFFIENMGQVAEEVKFYETGSSHATFFTEDGMVLALHKSTEKQTRTPEQRGPKEVNEKKATTEALRLRFKGANKNIRITGEDKLPGHVNYLIGRDVSEWEKDIPTYRTITYNEVYKNIDIRFYGNNKEIEHDVIVRPGGDISALEFAYEGIKGLRVTDAGDLEVTLTSGKIIQKRPIIYQTLKGERVPVDGSYRILRQEDGHYSYGFKVASYDRTKTLVIDPVLLYSTYLGGSNGEAGYGITIDNSGAAYITGYTISPDFPVVGPVQGFGGSTYSDAFVTKINPAGSAIVYSTFLGGSAADEGLGIVLDSSGAAYVAGKTASPDFPVLSAAQPVHGGVIDVFVTKLNPAGNAIIYSTFLGGSDEDWANAIALDSSANAYITGFSLSMDYPLAAPLQAAIGGPLDTFITKLAPTGDAIVYSTYLGGSRGEYGFGIAVDSAGAAYVTGSTSSTDFPTAAPIQSTLRGKNDAFITKINAAGSALLYSTYLGGNDEEAGNAITIDSTGAAYVTGMTFSADFPLVIPLQGVFGGISDAFITKLSPTGSSYTYSTYLGGDDYDSAFGIAVDSLGAAYVAGYTFSMDFPLIDALDASFGGKDEAFVTEITPDGAAIVYSTYIGGQDLDYGFAIAVDEGGSAYVTGNTLSTDLPLMDPLQPMNGGYYDAFISKIEPAPLPLVTLTIRPDSTTVIGGGLLGYTVTATNTTDVEECFQYWERVTLPGGESYPKDKEFFGPYDLCLAPGAGESAHFTYAIPGKAPGGVYVLNAFIGTHPGVLQKSTAFNFSLTAPGL